MFNSKIHALALPLLLTTLSASAQDNGNAATAPVEGKVPRLTVVIACGNCLVAPTVPNMIVDAYIAAADRTATPIAPQEEAVLSILSYSQRPPAARAMWGAFAGKDEIKASVSYRGQVFEVEDYFRNGWQGMNALAKNIGEMTYEKIPK